MNKLVSTAGFTLGATIIFSVVTLSQTLRITPTPIKIFDTPITVNIYENTSKPKSRITFVSLHHNEQVGLKLVKEAIKKRGGKLVEVVSASGSNPQRYLHFKYKERLLCVDPNRIFSKKGVASSLARIAAGDEGCENNLNDQTKAIIKEATVVSMIEDFQVKLTNLFKPIKSTEVLVSVHNNKLNGSINVRSFIKKGDPEYDNNQATYIVRDENDHDFLMVTNESLFKKITANTLSFSIGLQRQEVDEEEGYLSVFWAKKRWNYIIVEAEHRLDGEGEDHREAQGKMINKLIDVFP